jgi:hypothetical protein
VIPQIASLGVFQPQIGGPLQWTQLRIRTLFQNRETEAMVLLAAAAEIDMAHITKENKKALAFAQSHAKFWLLRHRLLSLLNEIHRMRSFSVDSGTQSKK